MLRKQQGMKGTRSAVSHGVLSGARGLVVWLLLGVCQATAQSSAPGPDYYRDIQPILIKSCITCHGPGKQESKFRIDRRESLLKGGSSGERALVAGNPAESHLLKRIASEDEDFRMPPKGSGLDATDIEKVRSWIKAGAVIPAVEGPVNPLTDHWSFQAVRKPSLPAVIEGWGRNEVDRFVGHRLRQANLEPSPAADRHTLVRRVYLVMLGIPPTPQEVLAFVQDRKPEAYQRLVERVLASQHYGERWAQHWLDCVRYAETTGYEINGDNGKIYPYRDYVIRAFNADKPYDQFLVEQLAGDQLGVDAATGFLVAGPHDVNKSPDPRLTAMQYQDSLDEIIKTTSAVMLGVTLGCARCHDHKYDPLSQQDYYAMQAVFAGTRYGNRREAGTENDRMQREADALEVPLKKLRQEMTVLEQRSGLEPPIDFRDYEERFATETAQAIRIRINAANDSQAIELDDIEVWAPKGAPVATNWAHRDAGATATSSPTAKGNQGKSADLLLDGTRQLLLYFRSVDTKDVWIKIFFDGRREFDRIVIKPRGSHVPIDYRIDVATGKDQWKQVVDSRDRFIHRQDLRDRDRIEFTNVSDELTDQIVSVNRELRELEAKYQALRAGPQIFAGSFTSPRETHLMVRGDPLKPGARIDPAAPAVLSHPPMAADISEKQRRLALARAIANARNPLTARVMVNRVWQHYFGVGIVDTPSDFGINGGRPTHPQLLDWLSNYLVEQGWSLKQLHRKLLMSAAFRQAAFSRPEARGVDADCRLLWRFPPRRLDAEAIRDSILLVSGRLNRQMYGPSFSFFAKPKSQFEKKTPLQQFAQDGWRRMIYGKKIRLEYVGIFGVFDCPDASQMAPSRSRSTTAVQALGLLNSEFVSRQARFLAEDVRKGVEGITGQVESAVFRTLGRPVQPAELKILVKVANQHDLEQVCRILLNLNEFVFVN